MFLFKDYLVRQLESFMTCLLQPKATEQSSYNKKNLSFNDINNPPQFFRLQYNIGQFEILKSSFSLRDILD